MKKQVRYAVAGLCLTLTLVLAGCQGNSGGNTGGGNTNPLEPASTQAGGPAPSTLPNPKTPPPSLSATGQAAKAAASAFIDWASASTLDQREAGRAAIEAARNNNDVAAALVDEVFAAQHTDHSRALMALAVLGELRNPVGEAGLIRFVEQPFPQSSANGPEGEDEAQISLGTLQAKAAEGLAYMRSERSDQAVLTVIAQHPARMVRAAAITAFVYNHASSSTSEIWRKTLAQYVRQDEQVFIDRPIKDIGESSESFNAKLAVYLRLHPELQAAEPGHGDTNMAPDPANPTQPPAP